MSQPGPDVREGPVPLAAIHSLLQLLYDQSPDLPDLEPLIPAVAMAEHARRFKIDVSLPLTDGATPRMSVNDSGEPEAFRERLLRTEHLHRMAPSVVQGWLDLCPPGLAQTTMSMKWGAAGALPVRSGLYYEELLRHPQGSELWANAFRFAGCPVPEPVQGVEMSVCVDVDGDRIVGVKDYWIRIDRLPEGAPPALQPFVDALPIHPRSGSRKFLFARRFDTSGELTGHKLLWISESSRPAWAARAWSVVANLNRRFVGRATPNFSRLKQWVAEWPFAPACVPIPDLVALNATPQGEPEDLIVYASVR